MERPAQAISFYKIFGYPTGLGALLVRRAAMPLLAGKLYFGGGTVAVSCADADVYRCFSSDRVLPLVTFSVPSVLMRALQGRVVRVFSHSVHLKVSKG